MLKTTDPIQDVIAAGVLAIAVLGYFRNRTAKRVASKIDDTATKIDEVHVMVNDQLSKAVDRRDISESSGLVKDATIAAQGKVIDKLTEGPTA